MAEHSAVNRRVVGSSPTRGAIYKKRRLRVFFFCAKILGNGLEPTRIAFAILAGSSLHWLLFISTIGLFFRRKTILNRFAATPTESFTRGAIYKKRRLRTFFFCAKILGNGLEPTRIAFAILAGSSLHWLLFISTIGLFFRRKTILNRFAATPTESFTRGAIYKKKKA